jgi:hypothetical protein
MNVGEMKKNIAVRMSSEIGYQNLREKLMSCESNFEIEIIVVFL